MGAQRNELELEIKNLEAQIKDLGESITAYPRWSRLELDDVIPPLKQNQMWQAQLKKKTQELETLTSSNTAPKIITPQQHSSMYDPSKVRYELMPKAGTYALGVEALRALGQEPLTFKQTLEARLNNEALFEIWNDTKTAIVYNARTKEFKIVPSSADLINIDPHFKGLYLPVNYNTVEGITLDCSRGIYNQPLTQAQILEHPAWLAAVEGDRVLLKNYIDRVFALKQNPEKAMAFYVRSKTENDEQRALYVHNLNNDSNAAGNINLILIGSFVRVAQL